MGSIFGLFRRDGGPIDPSLLERMRAAMPEWGRDGFSMWNEGCAALAQGCSLTTREARCDALPRTDAASGTVFTATGRVDNRADLARELSVPGGELTSLPDTEFLFRAYLRWGEEAADRIVGDWSFAAWHPADRRLYLARDPHGHTALYYYADATIFAFSSSWRSLFTLGLVSREIDELYLAQVLMSWLAYHGPGTLYRDLHRLPPAHTLTVTPERCETHRYWWLERVPIVRRARREDYIEGFREVFNATVRSHIRSDSPVGVTLSGGLDSSSVAATAAGFLASEGRRLPAYTSIPLYDTKPYVGARFGDEWPYAQATARKAGNIDLIPIDAANVTPIASIRRFLSILGEPAHAAGNFYWIQALLERAAADGCRVLLTGQNGNASISWHGSLTSMPAAAQLRKLGWAGFAKERAKRAIPLSWLRAWNRRRIASDREWYRSTALNPEFARRLRLLERRLDDPNEWQTFDPLEERYRFFLPGRSSVGSFWAELSAAFGVEVRDPTADKRVLEYTFSIPDEIFFDARTGTDRWVIRQAMEGRLPEEVRLNRGRGRQAGDLIPRLRAAAGEVESALAEVRTGRASDYLDVERLQSVWGRMGSEDGPRVFLLSVNTLTRGLMAGLYFDSPGIGYHR